MNNILFVNHIYEQCGIYQFGKMLGDALIKSSKYKFKYEEIDSTDKFYDHFALYAPKVIIFNYNPSSSPWLNKHILEFCRQTCKVGAIYHHHPVDGFDFYIHPNPLLKESSNNFVTNRLILNYEDEYKNNDIPVIGSFGFGLPIKGYDKIVTIVNDEFDEAIIRLNLTPSYFGDPDCVIAKETAKLCQKAMRKNKIHLQITHDFLSIPQTLDFLAGNSINIFCYHSTRSTGLSSAIDLALSVKRPIAITRSTMFDHILEADPSICLDTNNLKTILNNGIFPLMPFYEKYRCGNVIKDYENIIDKLI